MKTIDADALMMELSDWWYSSFGMEETEESKAIRTVMDQVEEIIKKMLVVRLDPEGMTRDEAIVTIRRIQEPEAYEPQLTSYAYDALEMAINALKQPEQKWIPCSVRLPEGKDPVLVSFSKEVEIFSRVLIFPPGIVKHEYKRGNADAWMPLPEPYKGGTQCPVCGRTYTDRPAISRRGEGKEICPECGMKEALEDWEDEGDG